MVILLASCSSDENPTPTPEPLTFDENLLLKTWTYDTILFEGTLYAYNHNPDCQKDRFVFRNNEGQVYQYDEVYFTNTYCTGNQTILTWKPVADHIDFYWDTVKIDEYKIISLTKDHFTFAIDRDMDNDGKKEHLVVTAIPDAAFNSSKITSNKKSNLKTFAIKLPLK
ncbi:hypothetical protein HYN56_21175 [Flavobacterium crocinum]|uniref:Lipocalin-like domain-containing protein n=1 Tax=Flavobacterium crocinum TaxID=2183896 RepID=A0A2S1YR90_9FLAO|nr:hypothetical protein [Flavobacterium crocinum]AWK06605.1 hypothetical protein HYN56_21175 [Flavobacterium crocinum]